jgi:hypothetical protein
MDAPKVWQQSDEKRDTGAIRRRCSAGLNSAGKNLRNLVRYVGGMLVLALACTACAAGDAGASAAGGGASQGSGQGAASSDGQNTLHSYSRTSNREGLAGGSPAGSAGAGSIRGFVTWPDGTPAANQQIYVFADGYPTTGSDMTSGTPIQTDGQGRYAINCECRALGANFYLDEYRNGGNQCFILLQSGGMLTVEAGPGAVVNWAMVDMPCSRIFVPGQSAASTVALLRAHPEISGGTWQSARQRTES